MKSPAFQWYPNDFLGSGKVAAMSLEEVGAYTILLSYDWSEIGLPDDMEILAKWCRVTPRRFSVIWERVKPNFILRDARWYNPRLEKERAKQAENRTKRQHAADTRWDASRRNAHASVVHSSPIPSAVASPSAISRPRFLEPLVEAMNDELSRRFADYRPVKVDQFSSEEYAEKIESAGVPLEAAERLLRKACRFFNPSKHGRGDYPGSLKYFAQSIIDDWKRDPKPMLEIIPSVVKGASA